MRFEDLYPGLNIETTELEFKGFLSEGEEKDGSLSQVKWLKTIAAFANGTGGILFVGVEDKSHKIVSLSSEEADKQSQLVYKECKSRLEPSLIPDVTSIPIPGEKGTRYLLKIAVKGNDEVPVMVKSKGSLTTYIRRFGITEIASASAIRSLVLHSERSKYDILETDVPFKFGDFSCLREEYASNRDGEELQEKSLLLKGIASKDGTLKKGALLFKDGCEEDETCLTIVKWPGIDRASTSLLAIKKMKGPITKVIREAASTVQLLSVNGIKKTDTGEKPLYSYPYRSVLEGIANAFAHRNYWMEGTQIQIDIFIDRLEITSPGSLLSGKRLTKEKDLANIIPQHRNKLIADILSLVGTIQGIGTGFDIIEKDYSSADLSHKPYVTCDDDYFKLVLPDLTRASMEEAGEKSLPRVFAEDALLSEKELQILSYCYLSKRTISSIAKHLGVSVSSYLKEKLIDKLVAEGYLIQVEDRPASYLSSREKVFIH